MRPVVFRRAEVAAFETVPAVVLTLRFAVRAGDLAASVAADAAVFVAFVTAAAARPDVLAAVDRPALLVADLAALATAPAAPVTLAAAFSGAAVLPAGPRFAAGFAGAAFVPLFVFGFVAMGRSLLKLDRFGNSRR